MRLARVQNYNTEQKIIQKDIRNVLPLSYSLNIFTDKDKLKLIEELERIVRASLEYKEYIEYLKDYMDMTYCAFFNNIGNKNRKFSIEIHHEPFTLFDIAHIVVDKAIRLKQDLNYFDLAEEIMEIHYRNLVGLIPLSITAHEAVHDGQLFIPLQAVFGNFIKFFEEYETYMDNDIKAILEAKIKMSKETTIHDFTVLAQKYVYVREDMLTKIDYDEANVA